MAIIKVKTKMMPLSHARRYWKQTLDMTVSPVEKISL